VAPVKVSRVDSIVHTRGGSDIETSAEIGGGLVELERHLRGFGKRESVLRVKSPASMVETTTSFDTGPRSLQFTV
jgi:hypothetical protein